jgi:hypothetical protein
VLVTAGRPAVLDAGGPGKRVDLEGTKAGGADMPERRGLDERGGNPSARWRERRGSTGKSGHKQGERSSSIVRGVRLKGDG